MNKIKPASPSSGCTRARIAIAIMIRKNLIHPSNNIDAQSACTNACDNIILILYNGLHDKVKVVFLLLEEYTQII